MAKKDALNIQQILSEFKTYGVTINPEFFFLKTLDVPIRLHIVLLLEAIGSKGLKLTAKGNLPVKIVEQLVKAMPTPRETHYAEMTTRYLEEEQPIALRARALCDISKLLRKVKGELLLTKIGTEFLQRSAPEQFLFLLHAHLRFNIAYLDGAQESELVNELQPGMLQLVRDKEKIYRGVDAYCALLIDQLPHLPAIIMRNIAPNSYISKDPMDEFETLIEIRLFKNYLVPFGLAQERGINHDEIYECCKTELLDKLAQGVHAIDFDLVLNKKKIHVLTQKITQEHLDIELFDDVIFMLCRCVATPLPTKEMLGEEMVIHRRFLGTVVEKHQPFYETLGSCVTETIRAYTQLEAKGSRGDLKEGFQSLIEALYLIAPKSTPFDLFQALNKMPAYLIKRIQVHYQIELDGEFSHQFGMRFNEEVFEDLGALFMLIAQLQKATNKSKRINTKIQQLAKESVIAFLIAVFSIYTFEIEG